MSGTPVEGSGEGLAGGSAGRSAGRDAGGPAGRSVDPVGRSGPTAVPHTPVEDVFGLLTGVFVASLGLFLIKSAGAVTGGTAGLALLVSYAAPVPFAVLFLVINLPFFALAVTKKGWRFTLRSLVCVAAVSGLTLLHGDQLGLERLGDAYGVLAGNLLSGIGLLVLFRHGASLGGFNTVALILQERMGIRAGYVQMALDVAVVVASLTVVPPATVLLSAIGAVVLNFVLALNHRPGRYLGY